MCMALPLGTNSGSTFACRQHKQTWRTVTQNGFSLKAGRTQASQRQIRELVPKRGTTYVAWMWFGYEKSEMDQKQIVPQTQPHNRLRLEHH